MPVTTKRMSQKIYVVEQMRTTVSSYNFDRLELLTLNSVSNEGVQPQQMQSQEFS